MTLAPKKSRNPWLSPHDYKYSPPARAEKNFSYFCESLDNALLIAYISTCFDGHLWAVMN